MKVERKQGSFIPIIITLENVSEALMLEVAVGKYLKAREEDNLYPYGRHSKDRHADVPLKFNDYGAKTLLDRLLEMGY